jgi:hypothetical protein
LAESDEDEDGVALPPIDDDDDDDGIDDVTDVWDEEKLKAALGDLHKDQVTGPATQSTRKEEASIQVDDALGARPAPSRPSGPSGRHAPQPAPSGGLSWPLTIGLALTLAVAVYLLVTFLK